MTGALAYVSGGDGAALFGVVYVAMTIMMVVATVKILNKAGYSGWWVLIMLVPLVNMAMYIRFAFADWPVIQAARRAQQTVPYYPQQPHGT